LSLIFGDVRPLEDESAELWQGLSEREVAQMPTMVHSLEQHPGDSYRGYGINE
jgi:hypothetical protein